MEEDRCGEGGADGEFCGVRVRTVEGDVICR